MQEFTPPANYPWAKSIALTLLASVSIEIGLLLYGTWVQKTSNLTPWTFHTLWELAALGVIVWIVSQLNVSPGNFFAAVMLGAFIALIGSILMPNFLEANYFGVQSRPTMDTHEAGTYGESEAYEYPLSLGFLYHRDSPELEVEFKERGEWNEYVGTQGFLNWQTGLALGFYPDMESIPQFNGGHGFRNRLALILTVGPVALSEMFIRGVTRHFPILLIAVVGYYVVKREHIWWAK